MPGVALFPKSSEVHRRCLTGFPTKSVQSSGLASPQLAACQTPVRVGLSVTSAPPQFSRDFFPGRFGTQTEIFQNTPRHTITFKEQSQEDVFGSDASMLGDFGFRRGK